MDLGGALPRPMTTKLFVLSLAAALAVALAGEAPSVSGTVKDPQGRPVPGAAITLYSRSSAAASTATTDSQGRYSFPSLTAGDYVVRAEVPGFAVYLAESFRLDTPVRQNI